MIRQRRTPNGADALAPAPAAIVPGVTVLGGRYQVHRVIGRGGMGTVYQVSHLHTGEHLALKLLDRVDPRNARLFERFRLEMQASARIGSEHIVRVTDAQAMTDQGGAFLVMELLDGCDLQRLLQGGPLAPAEALWILQQLAGALDTAHAAGIVHRDLKPANLFLHRRRDGSAITKILDFGIAKLMVRRGEGERTATDLTQAGDVLGSWHYMAPEQIRGQPSLVAPGTDRWALAVLTFQLLTGQHYFQGPDLQHQICSAERPPPSRIARELGPAFDAWFLRSCAADPQARWTCTREQVEQLALALAEAPAQQPPAALLQRVAALAKVASVASGAAAAKSPQAAARTALDGEGGVDDATATLPAAAADAGGRPGTAPPSSLPQRRWAGLLGAALALALGCLIGLWLLGMGPQRAPEPTPSPRPVESVGAPPPASLPRALARRPPDAASTPSKAAPPRRPAPERTPAREPRYFPTDN